MINEETRTITTTSAAGKVREVTYCEEWPGIHYATPAPSLVRITREGKGDRLIFDTLRMWRGLAPVIQPGVGVVGAIGRDKEGDLYVRTTRDGELTYCAKFEDAIVALARTYII